MCETKENRGSLPSYAWSPWKEGRSKEEQRELQEIQEIRIPTGSGSWEIILFTDAGIW